MIALLATALLVQATAAAPTRLWSATLPETPRAVAVADDGGCVAAITRSRITIVGPTGDVSWDTALLEPVVGAAAIDGAIAVSPSCDWVAAWTGADIPHVQLFGRDGFRQVVALPTREDNPIDTRAWLPRSLDISSDGGLLAVGSEFDRIAVITRRGVVTERITVSNLGQPVVVQFAAASPLLIVTGHYAVGVMRPDGSWLWKREVGSTEIAASRDRTAFASRFVTAHGPQVGRVEMLDASGRPLWTRQGIWAPDIGIAADGAFLAYAGSAAGYEDGHPVSSGAVTVSLVDREGRTLIEQAIDAHLVQVSADGRCIVLRESPAQDLVGRDLHLHEAWRLALPSADLTFAGHAPVVVLRRRAQLEAYRLPSCEAR